MDTTHKNKFKIEDRVRIVRILDNITSKELIGKEGVIDEVDPLPNGQFNYTLQDGTYVHEEELEPLP